MKPISFCTLVFSLLFAFSCATTSNVNDDSAYVKKEGKDCNVVVLYSYPDSGYTDLGQCQILARTRRKTKQTNREMEYLKQCACEKGGNAIVIEKSESEVVFYESEEGEEYLPNYDLVLKSKGSKYFNPYVVFRMKGNVIRIE